MYKSFQWVTAKQVHYKFLQAQRDVHEYRQSHIHGVDKVMWTRTVQILELCLKLITLTNIATKVAHITQNVRKVHGSMC